jgi:hypothetical protein
MDDAIVDSKLTTPLSFLLCSGVTCESMMMTVNQAALPRFR